MALGESVCLSPHKSDHLYVRVVLSSEEMTVTSVILLRFYSSFNRVALTTLENKIGTGKLQDILVLYCSNTFFRIICFTPEVFITRCYYVHVFQGARIDSLGVSC